ncbi:hypothetical protein ABW19_dt0205476 [Dactylella cylindrospora]|nr:hypothetical protein ABW19_dt0205476 [Dactylella cylindrospora]
MRIKQLFPDIPRQQKGKKESVVLDVQNGERIPKTPVLAAQKPKKMSDYIKTPYLRRHASLPNTKEKAPKKLSSVAEEEQIAFNYQMALLEEPPEWDLDAGIGSRQFETASLTPPAITTSRASSPSRMEKVAETSKKQLQKIASRLHYSQDQLAPVGERLSKSEPDLSQLTGKGHAGNISKQNQESRGRSRTIDSQERPRSRSGPPSWRMPPKNMRRNMPHVREASPLPSFPIGPVEINHHESAVMARAMWKNGAVRYEDQWGRRLVPIGRHNSFMFELWPVSEITEEDGHVEKRE